PYILGGAGVYAYNITRELAGKVDFHVLVPDKSSGGITTDVQVPENIKVERVPYLDLPGLRFPSAGMMMGFRYGKRVDEFDVVHSNSGMGFMLAGRKIETVHHTIRSEKEFVSSQKELSPMGRLNSIFYYDVRDWLEERSFNTSKGFVTVSNATKDSLVQDYGIDASKIQVTHNGVDVERFKPRDKLDARERLGLPADKKILLFVGRLEERKNLGNLIRAMNSLGECMLVLCGTGPMGDRLKSLANSLGISNVSFPGFIPERDLPYYYDASDLLVHPADVEGFCLTLVEALASGLPVLAQRKSGMADILDACRITDTLGDASPSTISSSVARMLADDGLGQRTKTHSMTVRKLYDWGKIAENTLKAYKSLP
ncbi:glycosyltransferase family 4 protein, partial [Candidatus Altiarchaeota archaeon]